MGAPRIGAIPGAMSIRRSVVPSAEGQFDLLPAGVRKVQLAKEGGIEVPVADLEQAQGNPVRHQSDRLPCVPPDDLIRRGVDPVPDLEKTLTPRRRDRPGIGLPAEMPVGILFGDLSRKLSSPLPQVDLLETRLEMQGDPKLFLENLCCLPGPRERTAVQNVQGNHGERFREPSRLVPPAPVERGVLLPLVPLFHIPVCFPVADEDQAGIQGNIRPSERHSHSSR